MEYSITRLGSDILVTMLLPKEKLLEDIVGDVINQMQQIIYEFVCNLSLFISDPEKSQEFSYYCKILSRDKKFMAAVDDIYKKRHKGFEKVYQMLK